jgi:hypothetical protein
MPAAATPVPVTSVSVTSGTQPDPASAAILRLRQSVRAGKLGSPFPTYRTRPSRETPR